MALPLTLDRIQCYPLYTGTRHKKIVRCFGFSCQASRCWPICCLFCIRLSPFLPCIAHVTKLHDFGVHFIKIAAHTMYIDRHQSHSPLVVITFVGKCKLDTPPSILNQQRCTQYHKLIIRRTAQLHNHQEKLIRLMPLIGY